MKTPSTRSKGVSQSQSQKSPASKGSLNRSVYSPGGSPPRANPRGRPPKYGYTPKATPASKTKKRALDDDFQPSEDEGDSEDKSAAGDDEGGHDNNNDADDDTVTKIWIRGTANVSSSQHLTPLTLAKMLVEL